jgi:DNA segregation ATPase FtsK/SpoIIIE, S-DNA-T family
MFLNKQIMKLLNLMNIKHSGWKYPPLSLLSEEAPRKADRGDIKQIAEIIEKTLESFSIISKVVEVNLGPAITQYAIEVKIGTKLSEITDLADDLALATESPTGQVRIEAPIPGRNLVGIEIPNRSFEAITLGCLFNCKVMRDAKTKLTVPLGLDASGNPIVVDIAEMPHILITGTTGSGKSVLINSFIVSLLLRASPDEVKLILIDPDGSELVGYNEIPHLLTPAIVQHEKALAALKWAVDEIDRRHKVFAERKVKNIDAFNELSGYLSLPRVVIFVENLNSLMESAPIDMEYGLTKLTQRGRAAGMHLIITTQQSSSAAVTDRIYANIPGRISFLLSKAKDSITVLNHPGAEKLLGRGDMLFLTPYASKPIRIQGAFVTDKEIKSIVDFIKSNNEIESVEEMPRYRRFLQESDTPDALFEEAKKAVMGYDRASASLLQRRLSIGYSRAARLLDQLEAAGIVGYAEGSKPRDVLIKE